MINEAIISPPKCPAALVKQEQYPINLPSQSFLDQQLKDVQLNEQQSFTNNNIPQFVESFTAQKAEQLSYFPDQTQPDGFYLNQQNGDQPPTELPPYFADPIHLVESFYDHDPNGARTSNQPPFFPAPPGPGESYHNLDGVHPTEQPAPFANQPTPPDDNIEYQRFIYKCHECRLGFKRRGMLVNHLAKLHPSISIDSVTELNLPILKAQRFYYCAYCDKVYKSNSKRKLHILKNHPGLELPISCKVVGATEPSEPGVPNASFSEPVGNVTALPQHCNWCHKQYASKGRLLSHLRKAHPEHLSEALTMGSALGENAKRAQPEADHHLPADHEQYLFNDPYAQQQERFQDYLPPDQHLLYHQHMNL